MRIQIWALLAGVALAPGVAAAQRPPARPTARPQAASQSAATGGKHEFGVDIGLAWVSPDVGDSRIRVGTPLAIRVGFVPRGRLMFEPRFALAFDSEGALGNASYAFTPELSLLYSMTPQRHRSGWYVLGLAGLNFVDAGVPAVDAGMTFSIGAGAGTRKRVGNAAVRIEGGLRFDTEDSGAGIPSQFSIGTRVGLSFWH
jgi:hypothetical protein